MDEENLDNYGEASNMDTMKVLRNLFFEWKDENHISNKDYELDIKRFKEMFINDEKLQLNLENYCNSDKYPKSYFLYMLEYGTTKLGKPKSGSMEALGLYFSSERNSYIFNKKNITNEEALEIFNKEILPFWKRTFELINNNEIKDVNDILPKFFKGYQFVKKFACLVKPDNYLAIFSDDFFNLVNFVYDLDLDFSGKFNAYEEASSFFKNNFDFDLINLSEFLWIRHMQEDYKIYWNFIKFLDISLTNKLKTKNFLKEYKGLKTKISFGQGTPADITWFAFLKQENTVSNGYYPCYLYDKKNKILYLTFEVSETKNPKHNWSKSIQENYEKVNNKLKRYNTSYIFKEYNLKGDNFLDFLDFKTDLNEIIALYKDQHFESNLSLDANNAKTKFSFDFSFEFDENLIFTKGEKERIQKMITNSLKQGKHIILIGPPGTGKSKLAKQICEKYVDKEYVMTTATSDWTTFDTIGGYMPEENNKLKFQQATILNCFKDVVSNKIQNKWLIIDEINRADIDKAFGCLFSALTGDDINLQYKVDNQFIKLRNQKKEELEIKENEYIIPKNWRIIATMNSLDKASLYEMSYAFMRRFAFIPVNTPNEIDEELVSSYLNCWKNNDETKIDKTKIDTTKISDLWNILSNNSVSIGPAIIEDVCKYIQEGELSDAITLYILPQLEGKTEEQCKKILKELEKYGKKGELRKDFSNFLGFKFKEEKKDEN